MVRACPRRQEAEIPQPGPLTWDNPPLLVRVEQGVTDDLDQNLNKIFALRQTIKPPDPISFG